MKVEMKPTLDYYELDKAIRLQFDLDDSFDIAYLFFPEGDFDTIQTIEFDDEALERNEKSNEEQDTVQRRLVLTYLRDVFYPLYSEVFVRYYW